MPLSLATKRFSRVSLIRKKTGVIFNAWQIVLVIKTSVPMSNESASLLWKTNGSITLLAMRNSHPCKLFGIFGRNRLIVLNTGSYGWSSEYSHSSTKCSLVTTVAQFSSSYGYMVCICRMFVPLRYEITLTLIICRPRNSFNTAFIWSNITASSYVLMNSTTTWANGFHVGNRFLFDCKWIRKVE